MTRQKLPRKIEILAPVGGKEQLLAAVRSGANAVYLGAKSFNARRNAENFDDQTLAEAVSYCHGRGVAVHVTLNTLFVDSETDKLIEEIRLIAQSGADAVIVQDLGVAALVRECAPTLTMHASTQLSIHNTEGAKLLGALGFKRVVLARELSAKEIAEIANNCGLEVEVFVHGAHCMSMSGNCYMSALFGERSGNRGLCAQPCRLDFKCNGRDYALSLKDMSLITHMNELVETGVVSLKIEGRMKRPEYVAAAVSACRDALAGSEPNMERLQAIFSRSGFTDGYFAGRRDVSMFGYRRKEDVTAAAGVLSELQGLYRGEAPLVAVDMELTIEADKNAILKITDGTHTVEVSGVVPQVALNRPTDRELAERGLSKTGGTPFYLDHLECSIGEGLMLPVSAINAMRKAALEQLLQKREAIVPHPFKSPSRATLNHPKMLMLRYPELRIRVATAEQLTNKVTSSGAMLILPLLQAVKNIDRIKSFKERIAIELPTYTFPENMDNITTILQKARELGFDKAMVGSLGALALAKAAGFECYGDFSLNVINSFSLREMRDLGLQDMTLSYECSLKNAKQLGDYLPTGILGYGYLPVMFFRNCPARTERGCGTCRGDSVVTDRMGNDFPLVCREKQYSQLLNPVPLYVGDKKDALTGLSFVTLYFTQETPSQCDNILDLWKQSAALPGKKTGGLYFRELQ